MLIIYCIIRKKLKDLESHCYLYGIANGDLIGPRPITILILNKAGVITLVNTDDSLLLINPKINGNKIMNPLLARFKTTGIYHVIGLNNDLLQITKRADIRFSIG